MTRFRTSLERLDAALELPQPERGRVLEEMAADLEDLYRAYRSDGVAAGEAERRAVQRLLPDPAALGELERLHRSGYERLLARLTAAARTRAEQALLATLAAMVLALTLAGLPLDLLLRDRSPFLLPVLGLGTGGVVVAVICAFRVYIRGVRSAAEAEPGLRLALGLLLAAPLLAGFGLLVDFYIAAGAITAAVDQSLPIMVALLRADGMLLVSALALCLAGALLWLLVQARMAAVRAAAVRLNVPPRLVVHENRRARDVA